MFTRAGLSNRSSYHDQLTSTSASGEIVVPWERPPACDSSFSVRRASFEVAERAGRITQRAIWASQNVGFRDTAGTVDEGRASTARLWESAASRAMSPLLAS